MKQRMEIIVVTEVDHKKNLSQEWYESELKKRIAEVCKEVLGTPKKHTEAFIEYGEPV